MHEKGGPGGCPARLLVLLYASPRRAYAAGPKINMIQYRNKTGYRRRLGHRQRYSQVRITGIGTETKPKAQTQAKATQAKPKATEKATAKAEED